MALEVNRSLRETLVKEKNRGIREKDWVISTDGTNVFVLGSLAFGKKLHASLRVKIECTSGKRLRLE